MSALQGPDRPRAEPPAIDEDQPFQRRVWRFERAGWIGMGLLILISLSGLLGDRGPLSGSTISNAELRIDYERFHRYQTPMTMTVHVAATAFDDGVVALLLNDALVEQFQIENIVPEPTRWELTEDGLQLRFAAAAGQGELNIRFYLEPERRGGVTAAVGLVGHAPLRFDQFIYP